MKKETKKSLLGLLVIMALVLFFGLTAIAVLTESEGGLLHVVGWMWGAVIFVVVVLIVVIGLKILE